MRRTAVRRTAEGLLRLERPNPLRRLAIVAAGVVLGVPAALLVAVGLVAVLPVAALAAPAAAVIAVAGLIARFIEERRRFAHRGRAQVVPLHR